MDLSFPAIKDTYTPLLKVFKIRPEEETEANKTAKVLFEAYPQYEAVSKATGVPKAVIAVMHMREAGFDKNGKPRFDRYLGNGQPLSIRTTIEPKNRGPFKSFYDGAVDALRLKNLHLVKEWTDERACHVFEGFNGFGYRQYRNIPSPYLWGGTTVQKSGKYVSDGVYDKNVMDPQLGCVPVYFKLKELEKTSLPKEEKKPEPTYNKPEQKAEQSKYNFFVSIIQFILSLFKR